MTYSPHSLITYNLAQLRKHMLAQGYNELQWRAALLEEERRARNLPKLAQRDPENLCPYGPQNHTLRDTTQEPR